MGSSLRVRILRQIQDLRALVPAWWDLLERAVLPQPTQTPLWLLTWWEVFGTTGRRELAVVVVETSAGQLVGLAPLVRRWSMKGGVVPVAILELMGSGEDREDEIFSEYIGVIAARGHETEVAEAVAGALVRGPLGGWDELLMPSMRADDAVADRVERALRARDVEVRLRSTLVCPYIELPSTWDAYLAGLDGQSRYMVRRTLRELDAWAGAGGAVLRRARDAAELATGWRILLDLHAQRWGGRGVFQSPRFRSFHERVTEGLIRGEGGSLDLLWLEVRGEPIAALYNIVHRGHVHFYQGGRKLDVPPRVRPGIALHLYAIRRAIEQGHATYDFLAQPDKYKEQLAPTHAHSLATLTAIAPTIRARASRSMRRAARLVVDFARELSSKTNGEP